MVLNKCLYNNTNKNKNPSKKLTNAKNRRLAESTAACDSLREQLEALLEEADLAAGRGDVETVKSLLAKSRFDYYGDVETVKFILAKSRFDDDD